MNNSEQLNLITSFQLIVRFTTYPRHIFDLLDNPPVRHPPQSGWLDGWGRLKGGRRNS